MRIIAISDTHCQLEKIKIPKGDILIYAGDLTYAGRITDVIKELDILKEKTKGFQRVLLTCGNHDWLGEQDPMLMEQVCKDRGITYLCDSSIEINNVKFYFSPYQPEFNNWAFNLPRGTALERKWSAIPSDVDVLVTHGPPYGILDLRPDGRRVGCMHLRKRIFELNNLKYHIFGHIHGGYGKLYQGGVHYRNVSVCTEEYLPINKPTVINLA